MQMRQVTFEEEVEAEEEEEVEAAVAAVDAVELFDGTGLAGDAEVVESKGTRYCSPAADSTFLRSSITAAHTFSLFHLTVQKSYDQRVLNDVANRLLRLTCAAAIGWRWRLWRGKANRQLKQNSV
jgi:hypothetical protein